MATLAERINSARRMVDQERRWMKSCGETLSGYLLKYGSKDNAEHYGDGGEAIYAADLGALQRAEATLEDLKKKAGL